MTTKITAGAPLPELDLPLAGGGDIHIGGEGGWRMVVVYRGLHCPKCKAYLTKLKDLARGFADINTDIITVSGDPEEKAEAFKQDLGLDFPVAYGLTVEQMKDWGLYVSNPRSPEETDRPFPEPGLFILRPDGTVQIADVSNAPFARPDLDNLLGGLTFIQAKDYPVRGTGG